MMLSRTWIARLPLNLIHEASLEYQVPWTLIAAIVQQESAGDRFAIRFEPDYKYLVETKKWASECNISEITEIMLQKSSFGLAQIMGGLCRELGHTGSLLEVLDPELNLKLCAKHLTRLIKRFPDRNDLIAAYNAGTPVKKMDGTYRNQHYVTKVNQYLNALNEAFDYKEKK
jgi:soluble lytic murein transglycosylase-like protein